MSAHILVIEDEEAINDLICMNLEVTGYLVTAFFWTETRQVKVFLKRMIMTAPFWT